MNTEFENMQDSVKTAFAWSYQTAKLAFRINYFQMFVCTKCLNTARKAFLLVGVSEKSLFTSSKF